MKSIQFRTKEKFIEWTDSIWPGNPSLNLQACVKTFKAHRAIPVWIFGTEYSFSYCVAAGASSDYSYTGHCVECKTIEDAKKYVDQKHLDKKLIK